MMLRLVFILLACSLLLGCSSSYLVERPHVLEPCHSQDAQEMATAAVIKALQSKRWAIEGADVDAGLVRAEACRGSYCISVDVQVGPDGVVEVRRTPGQYLSGSGGRLLQHWMRHLDQAYERYRCSTPDMLRAEMEKQIFPTYRVIKAPVES